MALEAVKLAPTLVPAAALAGRMLAEGGELRKASRIVAKAWRANPHPDLAQTYADLRFGDAARDRLARIEALVKKDARPHRKRAGGGARRARRARIRQGARRRLPRYLSAPTRRVALLMAELERAEHNDEGRAREWMARALNAAPDPQWTADGHVSDRWLPVSPVTGRLDAFEWRVPLTGMVSGPTIEPELPSVAPVQAAASEPVEPEAEEAPHDEEAPQPHEDAVPLPPPEAPPSAPRRARRPQPKVEPVIPLVHAPDDPGVDEG